MKTENFWLFLIIIVQLIIFSLPLEMPIKFSLVILTLCVILWMSEIVPVGIVGLIPIVLAPLFSIVSIEKIATSYSTKIIFLLISGFIMASVVTKWKIDRKITYFIVKKLGKKPIYAILALILSTAILSLFLPNTTAAALMLPVGIGILNATKGESKEYKASIILAIAYAASAGGISLIIGTPPNLIATQYMQTEQISMDFLSWSKMILPFSMIFLIVLWIYLAIRSNPPKNVVLRMRTVHLKHGSKIVILILILTVLMWIFKAVIFEMTKLTLDDVMIGVLASILFFVIKTDNEPLLRWDEAHIPWDIILMFGGGLALGEIVLVSGTAEWVTSILAFIPVNAFLYLIIISALTTFSTEFLSNTALASVLMPIVIHLYKSAGFNPIVGILTVAISSSMAFMLPIATPPNAIAYKSRFISFGKMAKYGLFLNIISIILWVLYVVFFLKLL